MTEVRRTFIETLLRGGSWTCGTCGSRRPALSGERLRRLRKSKNLSLRALIRESSYGGGVSRLSELENGRKRLTVATAEKLLLAMGIQLPD